MADTLVQSPIIVKKKQLSSDMYRSVWRWHFYAGLMVLPFLISMAITGGLYLFHNEIDNFIHADLKIVSVMESNHKVAPSTMVEAATNAYGGVAVKYTDPTTPKSSAEITIKTTNNQMIAVYVNPYDGKVLGSLPDRGTVMWTIRTLHSLKYFGPVARASTEIAGGWAILLVGTGFYLWWPKKNRKTKGGVVSVRGTPKQRIFWRDLHAVIGVFIAFFIVFLAITGMPWSGVWGGKVNQWANGNNFGYPTGVRVSLPMSDEHLNHVAKTSWSLEQAQMPQSLPQDHDMNTHQTAQNTPISLDMAVNIFDKMGLQHGYAVNLPLSDKGVYTGSVYPNDLSRQRVVHLNQYSGQPLIDMSYKDYGPLGRALEWGINVHMGQEFGLANQLVLLTVCFLIIVLAISGGIMWWKRRPVGGMGIPPMPIKRGEMIGVLSIMLIVGVIFPLVGLSLVVMLILDFIYLKWKKRHFTA